MTKLMLILSVLLAFNLSFAANVETCGQIENPLPYSYCITKTEGSTSTSVLYYLHGGGGSEQQWGSLSSGIYAEWSAKNVNPPVVINVSFGPYWLLVEQNASLNSGLLDFFELAVIPQMEMIALGQLAQERMLFGLSMGGFNSVKLLAKIPAKTFKRAALVCPAIVDLNPYATKQEIADYAQIHGADPKALDDLAFIVQAFIPDAATWDAGANPLVVLDKLSLSETDLFIATNADDKTFAAGGVLLGQKMTALKANTVVQSWPGGHCDLDSKAIANFLIP
ncbi:MAG: hypothetical protein IT287_02745 [Bdellovibrionaceae bacterium]|nr:hypothetical protein [Pseudobdellovibrionaceae bacterium]